jgi:adenosylmethionine-8-amino-7-oxononanoate aminotransferase
MAPGALLEDVEGKPSARGNNGATAPTTNIAKQGLRDAILHRNARSTPLTLESAHGSRYKVSDGTKEWDVFDASGGASVACIGHNDSRPLQAVLDHFASTGITYAPSGSFRTKISETFAKLLIRTTDCQMAKAVFYSSGFNPFHFEPRPH